MQIRKILKYEVSNIMKLPTSQNYKTKLIDYKLKKFRIYYKPYYLIKELPYEMIVSSRLFLVFISTLWLQRTLHE